MINPARSYDRVKFSSAIVAVALVLSPLSATAAAVSLSIVDEKVLRATASEAQAKLRQTFVNVAATDFKLAPLKGPIYQASVGGKIIYYAPDSEHLLFAALYDKNGVNLTALAQEDQARSKLKLLDPAAALAIGPKGAPEVIEFTDPDCPYCRALDQFWSVKAAEGKPVRRLIYFVSAIHPDAAKKAEHIVCSPDPAAAFKDIYAGKTPKVFVSCAAGAAKVTNDRKLSMAMGVTGTPTLWVDGQLVSGFRQDELEAFLGTAHDKVASRGAH